MLFRSEALCITPIERQQPAVAESVKDKFSCMLQPSGAGCPSAALFAGEEEDALLKARFCYYAPIVELGAALSL